MSTIALILVLYAALISISVSGIIKGQALYDVYQSQQVQGVNVQNCGPQNSTDIFQAIYAFQDALFKVFEDLDSATPSTAYDTFFKDFSNVPFISSIFKNVSAGALASRSSDAMDPLFGLIPLTYFCANALDQVNISYVGQDKPVDAYSDCVAHPSMLIYGLIGSPFVIICPNFWTHVSSYPPPNNCLTVNTSIDRFRGNGESLIYYKLWMLFESIVNYYLSSRTLAVGRILEVNQCVALNAQDARYNARSYLYYFACLYGACRDFPGPRPPAMDRELLEGINTTTLHTTTSSSSVMARLVSNVTIMAVDP